MDFLEAMEGPVVEKIGGVNIEFPPLEIDDYTPWIASIVEERKQIARKTLPASGFDPQTRQAISMDVGMRWNLNRQIESIECGLEAVGAKVYTVPGAKKILEMSLAKAGRTKEEQQQIIRRIKPQRLHLLAMEVSGLFEKIIPATTSTTDNSDPNSPSPAQNESAAGGATGSPIGA